VQESFGVNEYLVNVISDPLLSTHGSSISVSLRLLMVGIIFFLVLMIGVIIYLKWIWKPHAESAPTLAPPPSAPPAGRRAFLLTGWE